MQDAAQVALALEEIALLLELAREPKFKIRAYEHAAQVVKTLGTELAPRIEQDGLRGIQGIGVVLSSEIQELWNTGSSPRLVRLRSTLPEGASELVRVEGLSPRRIRVLHEALGIHSVEELRAACVDGRVRGLPRFGDKTEQRLLAACERWLNRNEEEPAGTLLSKALELAAAIEGELLEAANGVYRVGALRRGEELVKELEFVVVGDPGGVLNRLSGMRRVVRLDRQAGVAQLAGGLSVKIQGDAGSLGTALVLSTGTAAHVAALAERASQRGFSLTAPPIARGLPTRTFANETELYAALGLPLIPPERRLGPAELEEAIRVGFDDLLAERDIRGMVHCHTNYSDGKNTILEMASAAQALGMEYITITDHSASAQYARGVTLDRLKQQWDEIAAAEEQVAIRILRGTESDILADGKLDYPDAVLEQFDVLIASIHARHRMGRNAMTERLVRALSLPVFKIWGHALGRILNHRDPIECDVPAVLDALAASRGAIEVNADPHRLDLPPSWIPAARARGIPFVVSVDAHSTWGLGALRYGVIMARRGGLRRAEVLNTAPAQAFAARVHPT